MPLKIKQSKYVILEMIGCWKSFVQLLLCYVGHLKINWILLEDWRTQLDKPYGSGLEPATLREDMWWNNMYRLFTTPKSIIDDVDLVYPIVQHPVRFWSRNTWPFSGSWQSPSVSGWQLVLRVLHSIIFSVRVKGCYVHALNTPKRNYKIKICYMLYS